MARRNDKFLRQATEAIASNAKPGFHGEVTVQVKIQNGVIQSGHVEKSTRVSRQGNTTLVEKIKLD